MRLKGQKSAAELALESFLEQHPGLDLHDAVDHYLQNPLTSIGQEEVRDYSAQAVGFIATDASSINEWLVKSLDHLDERMEEYGAQARGFEDQAKKLPKNKVSGSFSYRSIMRNLSTGESVVPETLAVELDKFLTKIHSILSHGSGGEFQKLMKLMEDFELGEGSEDKLQGIFEASRAYYKSMLPSQQSKDIYGLEIPEGRELWMDKTVFLGGKVFYSFTPTELSQSSGSLWSGYVRSSKSELDLKENVPYLTKAQCQAVCKALQRHATGLLRAKAYQNTADRLLALSRDLNRKYNKAKEQRKYSAKPYILLMNMTVSHLYGIQIKAINQAEGIYKAALKYVDKSLEALEEKKSA